MFRETIVDTGRRVCSKSSGAVAELGGRDLDSEFEGEGERMSGIRGRALERPAQVRVASRC